MTQIQKKDYCAKGLLRWGNKYLNCTRQSQNPFRETNPSAITLEELYKKLKDYGISKKVIDKIRRVEVEILLTKACPKCHQDMSKKHKKIGGRKTARSAFTCMDCWVFDNSILDELLCEAYDDLSAQAEKKHNGF